MYPCGTIQRPFNESSPVNLTPVQPTLVAANIPKDKYAPAVACETYSVPVSSVTYGTPLGMVTGLDQDAEVSGTTTIPRMPFNLTGAPGTDAHYALVDTPTGVVHNFQSLKNNGNGAYTGSWTYGRLNGTGFGSDTRPRHGPRAIGCNLLAGLITATDIADGKDQFDYAPVCSLTFSGLNRSKVWPATGTDADTSANIGSVPYGRRLMLPPTFNLAAIQNPFIRRIAKTAMLRGMIVADRNEGCPFEVYVQQGVNLASYKTSTWDADLDTIRAGLMQMTDCALYLDGNGQLYAPEGKECHSLRGAWRASNGGVAIAWLRSDSMTGALTVSTGGTYINYDNRAVVSYALGLPQTGDNMILRVYLSDPTATLNWNAQNGTNSAGTGSFAKSFQWPSGSFATYIKLVCAGPCTMMISLVNKSR